MHEWPGNVRELERLMERAVALAETDTIELDASQYHRLESKSPRDEQ